jgi:hypothetical protein
MSHQTLDDLLRYKNRGALPTWDATISALLKSSTEDAEQRP